MCFIIPFKKNLVKVRVYVQVQPEMSFVFIKSFSITNQIRKNKRKNQIDYLLDVLKEYTLQIKNATLFYCKIGIEFTERDLPIIKNNSIIWQKTELNNESLITRLTDELHIGRLMTARKNHTSIFDIFEDFDQALDLETAKQDHDPLKMYLALRESELIMRYVPHDLLPIILSYFSYIESTINGIQYPKKITSSPADTFSECSLLINSPKNTKLIYTIRSLKYKCGFYKNVSKNKWPEDARVYFQIEIFNGRNHTANQRRSNEIVWRSNIITCGKSNQIIQIKNMDLKLKPNNSYLLWVEVLSGEFHALYTRYDPHFENKNPKMIYKQLKHKLVREIKLCGNTWCLCNVSKIWEIDFYPSYGNYRR
eukprot:162305_1